MDTGISSTEETGNLTRVADSSNQQSENHASSHDNATSECSSSEITTAGAQKAGPREWAAVAVLTLPVLLISVDMTVLNFAVPHISRDLGAGSVELLWIVDIYSFVLAALLVSMGALGDRIGRRKLLMFGAAGFGVASLITAFAPSAGVMIAARALLGVAGATLMPSTLSLIRSMFPDGRQRQTAIAVWASALSAGSALGPLLGGALLEFFWWGSLFLINVPITILVIVFAPILVRESKAAQLGKLDPVSVLLLAAAMFPVVYGIKSFAEHGFDPLAAALFLVGAASGVVFVRRQLKLDEPLLDIGLFSIRPFTIAVMLNLITLFAMIAALFFLTQYLQIVLGLNPFVAGLSLLPGLLLAVLASFLAVPVSRWLRTTGTLVVGVGLMVVGFVMFTLLPDGEQVTFAAIAFSFVCFGMGLAQTLTNDAVVSSAPEERAGAASAVSETGYELGAALGVAVLGSVLLASYQSGMPDAPGEAARSVAGAAELAGSMPGGAGEALLQQAFSAFISGIHVTSAVAAAILIAAAVTTAVVLRKARAPEAGAGS
ncbi:MFS transporter, DHA2 family, multidrug resistance protein [Saccharopolyspora kobensis]|uniref:MFS transporter, DHA2 family, multidrug resistance protein n=2 Tax=Saccharopolyspora kobensis TaxID=146035 RepID=A0A1H5UXT4_9PSEU|nr:MFS transporter, DHA2 family, multidrug resistance protein [Saccharopolyspora kobensis]SFC67752.1 MFS transporter, DHA2 family, multidrug resistance protein [Saccharopolyspora kobensis]